MGSEQIAAVLQSEEIKNMRFDYSDIDGLCLLYQDSVWPNDAKLLPREFGRLCEQGSGIICAVSLLLGVTIVSSWSCAQRVIN